MFIYKGYFLSICCKQGRKRVNVCSFVNKAFDFVDLCLYLFIHFYCILKCFTVLIVLIESLMELSGKNQYMFRDIQMKSDTVREELQSDSVLQH